MRAIIDIGLIYDDVVDKAAPEVEAFYKQFKEGLIIVIATGEVNEDGTRKDGDDLKMEVFETIVPLPIKPVHLAQALTGILIQVKANCEPTIKLTPGAKALNEALGKKFKIIH